MSLEDYRNMSCELYDAPVYWEEDVKKTLKRFKEKWKQKMKRMELISVDVAIYELNNLVEEEFGEGLTK